MKSQYYSFLLLFCFSLLGLSASAQQQGFVQLNDGSLLKGTVVQNGDQYVIFQAKSQTKSYHGSQLLAWGTDNGKVFHFLAGQAGDTTKTFKRCLVQGALSLYQYGDHFLVSEADSDSLTLLTVEKTVEGTHLKVKKRYVGALTYLLRNCSAILPAIPKVRFELKALSNLIFKFNECIAPGEKNTKYLEFEKVQYEWGIHAGTTGNTVQLLTDDQLLAVNKLKFSPQWAYAFGAHLQANFKSNFSVRLGINYAPKPTKGSGSTPYESFSATLDNTWLEIPVSAVYYLRRNKRWNTYLLGGGVATFTRLGENYRVVTQLNGKSRVTPLLLNNYGVGFTVGSGLRWQLNKNTKLDLEYYYQRTSVTFVYSVNFFAHHIHFRIAQSFR